MALGRLGCGVWIMLLASAASGARAEQAGITVLGSGEVQGKPDHLEIDLKTGGSAELAGDAIVKYRDAQRRAVAALGALKLKSLEIQPRGLSISSGGPGGAQEAMLAAMGRGQGEAVKSQVGLSKDLRIVLREIQKMPEEELMATVAKVLDTAKDAGATIGTSSAENAMAQMMFGGRGQSGSPAVTFVLDDVG